MSVNEPQRITSRDNALLKDLRRLAQGFVERNGSRIVETGNAALGRYLGDVFVDRAGIGMTPHFVDQDAEMLARKGMADLLDQRVGFGDRRAVAGKHDHRLLRSEAEW